MSCVALLVVLVTSIKLLPDACLYHPKCWWWAVEHALCVECMLQRVGWWSAVLFVP